MNVSVCYTFILLSCYEQINRIRSAWELFSVHNEGRTDAIKSFALFKFGYFSVKEYAQAQEDIAPKMK